MSTAQGKTGGYGIQQLEEINSGDEDEDEEESDDEPAGPKFKVVIENAEPAGVKISKKNTCIIEIINRELEIKNEEEHVQLINYFMGQKKPTWSSQFLQAVMLSPTVDEDHLIVEDITLYEALVHFVTMFWKLLFALIPPTHQGGGWPAFCIALCMIGTVTAVVAEVATVLGCTIGLKAAVTAITLVAIGTSLPDTFASMTAARNSETADSAIGNVTGSNSVNVFVGLGLPWVISAYYADSLEEGKREYVTPAGNLAFSVMLFLITSSICFIVLIARRIVFGGELGGPPKAKIISTVFLIFLWVVYVTFSSLKAYNMI
jgi:solute carrier family 8 (sodium/calcium exchanger)